MKKEEEKSPYLMAVLIDLCKPNRELQRCGFTTTQRTYQINVMYLYYCLSSLLSSPVLLLVPALVLILPWQAIRGCQSGRKLIQKKKKKKNSFLLGHCPGLRQQESNSRICSRRGSRSMKLLTGGADSPL